MRRGGRRAYARGPDDRGIPLEVVAIELDDGDLLVIHAMRMRRKYRSAYGQVMAWL